MTTRQPIWQIALDECREAVVHGSPMRISKPALVYLEKKVAPSFRRQLSGPSRVARWRKERADVLDSANAVGALATLLARQLEPKTREVDVPQLASAFVLVQAVCKNGATPTGGVYCRAVAAGGRKAAAYWTDVLRRLP